MKARFVFTGLCLALICLCAPGVSLAAQPKTHTNSIGMEFVLIPAGELKKGKSTMIVSKPFYLGKYEVTQDQWQEVMRDRRDPSQFTGGKRPVENVAMSEVRTFIKRLNIREGHQRYRLPTSTEWELAARGGTDREFHFMPDPPTYDDAKGPLADYAWTIDNSGRATHAVGEKKPNQYGLYDMYGNVWELVRDWYSEKAPTEPVLMDYSGPATGEFVLIRGGCFVNGVSHCRSSGFYVQAPEGRTGTTGFRLAISVE